MSDPNASRSTPARPTGPVDEPPRAPLTWNPWVVLLMVVALVLFILAAVQYGLGDAAATATFDNETGPTHDVLAMIHFWAAAILATLSVMTVIVLLGVAAVRYQADTRAD